jgi:hypothetical protein
VAPSTLTISAVDAEVQKDGLEDTEPNNAETPIPTATMEFSVLDVITFSATVTKDCIVVIKDPNKTVLMKIWAMFTIINNFMNREAFFYIDLIICVEVFNIQCYCYEADESLRILR